MFFRTGKPLVDDRVRIGWAELRSRVDRLAAGLLRAGIVKGECVLVPLPDWAEYVYFFFALQKIGAVPVVLISGYRQLEMGLLAGIVGVRPGLCRAPCAKSAILLSWVRSSPGLFAGIWKMERDFVNRVSRLHGKE
jgi:hypothetical protein